MVVSFVFFVPFILIALMIMSVWLEQQWLGAVTSFGIIAFGVYVLIYGMETVPNNDLLVITIGTISIALGAYTLLKDYVEEFQSYDRSA